MGLAESIYRKNMKKKIFDKLSRRERQIMDILYRVGEATVSGVKAEMADPPGYSAVRAMLGILGDKKMVTFRKEGRAYVYRPAVSPETARESALKHVVQTFFDGRVTEVVASLVDQSAATMTDEELDRLEELVKKSRQSKEGK